LQPQETTQDAAQAASAWLGSLASSAINPADSTRPAAAKENLRVLAVVPGNGQGSSFIFARRQIASLADLNVKVHTFFLRSRSSPLAMAKEWIRLRREIRQFCPHVVHAHYGTATSLLCALATKLPLVITFRGNDLGDDPDLSLLRTRLGQLFSQISCLRATRIICVCRLLHQLLWWHRSRVVVIPTGVDLNLFQPEPRHETRALLGWNAQERIVLFDEGDSPRRKGVNFLKSALRVAEEAFGPIRLVILDRSVPPELVPRYLNAADCLALASVFEGSPNIVKEALACNLPVVATDVGDVAERLEGVTPSRIAKREVGEFARALVEVLLESRRSNGRDLVQSCSMQRVAEAIRQVYELALVSGEPEALRLPAGMFQG
jgi:teichuronic acid biosynthesis glycosyltransferase TuaC